MLYVLQNLTMVYLSGPVITDDFVVKGRTFLRLVFMVRSLLLSEVTVCPVRLVRIEIFFNILQNVGSNLEHQVPESLNSFKLKLLFFKKKSRIYLIKFRDKNNHKGLYVAHRTEFCNVDCVTSKIFVV